MDRTLVEPVFLLLGADTIHLARLEVFFRDLLNQLISKPR